MLAHDGGVCCDAGEQGVCTVNLKLHPSMGANRGRAKAVLASFAMNSLLIGGVYSPWTGEGIFSRCRKSDIFRRGA